MSNKYSIFKNSKSLRAKLGKLLRSFPALPAKTINISSLAIVSEPQYFVVYKSCKKKTPPEFKSIGEYMYEIRWGIGELANPDVDPVGVFGYSGNRRYIWQNKFWAELDIHSPPPLASQETITSLIYPLNEEFGIN